LAGAAYTVRPGSPDLSQIYTAKEYQPALWGIAAITDRVDITKVVKKCLSQTYLWSHFNSNGMVLAIE
jgi:hypothetical protein